MAKQPGKQDPIVTVTAKIPLSARNVLRAAAGDIKFSAFLRSKLIELAALYTK